MSVYEDTLSMLKTAPRLQRYELHCHPGVAGSLKEMTAFAGKVHDHYLPYGSLFDVQMFAHDLFPVGYYEVRKFNVYGYEIALYGFLDYVWHGPHPVTLRADSPVFARGGPVVR